MREDHYIRMDRPYPMYRCNHRKLAPDYRGPLFIWDIDKTYLDTRFSQLKHLARIPFEFGVDKRGIPGTVALLQGLRDGPVAREMRPLYFVSASPHQLRNSIEKRMLMDGVEFDGIAFKDPVRVVLRGQLDQLKEQIGFKLAALLLFHCEFPPGAEYLLFGDDAERDALIYTLFADICAGRLRGRTMEKTLMKCGVRGEYAAALASTADECEPREAVRWVYIHLIRDPAGHSIAQFGPHVVGHPTAAGAAAHLFEQGYISREQNDRVAAAVAD